MATSFPAGLDALTNPTSADSLASPDHAAQHANVNDAVEAIEVQIGTTASPVLARLASPTFTGTVTAPTFSGALSGNASTATTVTTNANLTGHITSTGNAAVLGSFTSAQLASALTDETGTGANVFAGSPTLTGTVTAAALTVTNATTSGSYLQGTDYLSPYQGFRNKIINGDFSIWQRGTGSTALAATASTSFLADRWSGYRATLNSTQIQISSGLAGFQYALRIQRNSGSATNKIYIGQSFETSSIATFAGKTMVVSFYARAGSNFSAASSLFTLNVYSGTGTECNVVYVTPTGLTTDLSTTFTLTTSWQRFSASYNVPSSVTQHGLEFNFLPVGPVVGNDYVDITGVQLEQGSVATPFEYRPIGTELALCQRYYMRWNTSGVYGRIGHGHPISSTVAEYLLPHIVIPRIRLGTLSSGGSFQHSDGVTAYAASAFTRVDVICSERFFGFTAVGSTLNTYRPMYIEGSNSATAFIASDMEL